MKLPKISTKNHEHLLSLAVSAKKNDMNHPMFFLLICLLFSCDEPVMNDPTPEISMPEPEIPEGELTFLALGDSYTIGESVNIDERFPMQLAAQLGEVDLGFKEVKIIAKTGWTTNQLQNGIAAETNLLDSYSIVTLLIGVNNQYSNLKIEQYESEFPQLLNQAIEFAGGNKDRVFVVSIPDYAYTPFGRGNEQISEEIDEYNELNRKFTEEAGVTYFDITPISRKGLDEPELVASDNLHPSGEQYRRWANLMFATVRNNLK